MIDPFKYQRRDNCFKVDLDKLKAAGPEGMREFTELRAYQFHLLMDQADEEDRIRKGEFKNLEPCRVEGFSVNLN